nr:MAG TPA: hypothetical protein [Caudoviricetes sp.]
MELFCANSYSAKVKLLTLVRTKTILNPLVWNCCNFN